MFLLDEWLRDAAPHARHVSNFPVKLDPWTDANGIERRGLLSLAADRGHDPDTVRAKVRTIDPEEMRRWENQGFTRGEPYGPWNTFQDVEIAGWHIAIDECHHYCGETSPPAVKRRWQKWLGELRHQGATVEFLSQHEKKVADVIKNEAEMRYELVNGEHRRDPILGIKLYVWYNIRAKLGLGWKPASWQLEKHQQDGKWVTIEEAPFTFDSEYYGAYDSYAAPIAGGTAGSSGKPPYLLYSHLGFWWWVFSSEFTRFWYAFCAVFAFCLVMYFRNEFAHYWLGAFRAMAPRTGVAAAKAPPAVKTVDGKPVPKPDDVMESAEGRIVVPDPADRERLARLITAFEDLKVKFADQQQTVLTLTEEKNALQKKLDDAAALVAVGPNAVQFRGGFQYAVGETIDQGKYQGKKIASVDFRRRACTLDDGTFLSLMLDAPSRVQMVASEVAAVGGSSTASVRSTMERSAGVAVDNAQRAAGVWRPRDPQRVVDDARRGVAPPRQ